MEIKRTSKRLLFTFLLMISFIISLFLHSSTVLAEGSMTDHSSKTDNSVNADFGAAASHSAWLFYLVDENGNEIGKYDPQLVTADARGIVDFSGNNLLKASNVMFYVKTRQGRSWNPNKGVTQAKWGYGPYNEDQSGNGSELKQWLLEKDTINNCLRAKTLVKDTWDQEAADKWESKEYFLVFEVVAWNGIYDHGKVRDENLWWLGTTRCLGDYQDRTNINDDPNDPPHHLRGDSKVRNYTNLVYVQCVELENKEEVVKMGFDVNLRVGSSDHSSASPTSGLFFNREFSDAKTGYGIGIVWNDVPIIKTYDPPNGSPGKPENPEPNKKGTANIVKSYYTEIKDKDTGLVTKYTDDGTFYVTNCTKNIQILNEPEYQIVEWKISTNLDTGIRSTDGNEIIWNPPDHISRNGTAEEKVMLNDSEKVVYLLLKKEEEGTGIHTYHDPNSPGKPEDPEPDKKGDCNIVKSYYTVKKEGDVVQNYINDGTFFVTNCTNHIYIDDEPEYQVVGWKISTTLDTGIQSTDGTTITWNPPSSISRSGSSGAEVELTGTEKVV